MIVVADTSVFLNLACVRQQHLLVLLYQQVFAPPEVKMEFERAVMRYPRFAGLLFPEWVSVRKATLPGKAAFPFPQLDPGEMMAIILATEIHADAVLIDERAGRRAAEALGLTAMGIIGVLVQAKKTGHIARVAPTLDSLAREANFYLNAEVRTAALQLSGEVP